MAIKFSSWTRSLGECPIHKTTLADVSSLAADPKSWGRPWVHRSSEAGYPTNRWTSNSVAFTGLKQLVCLPAPYSIIIYIHKIVIFTTAQAASYNDMDSTQLVEQRKAQPEVINVLHHIGKPT